MFTYGLPICMHVCECMYVHMQVLGIICVYMFMPAHMYVCRYCMGMHVYPRVMCMERHVGKTLRSTLIKLSLSTHCLLHGACLDYDIHRKHHQPSAKTGSPASTALGGGAPRTHQEHSQSKHSRITGASTSLRTHRSPDRSFRETDGYTCV